MTWESPGGGSPGNPPLRAVAIPACSPGLEITADKTERLPLPPLVGGLLLVAGVVLILKK